MSDDERDTTFLQEIIGYDRTAESLSLGEEITLLQGKVRVLRRAVFWMVVLTALAVAALGYAVILSPDDPANLWRFFRQVSVKVPCALGLASLSSLVCFTGLGVVYRKRLNRRREKAHRLAERFLVSRLRGAARAKEPKAREEIFEVPIRNVSASAPVR